MTRRQTILALAALGGACASADKLVFDRGAFAITFEKLLTSGLALLDGAIMKNTKAGVPNAYAVQLTGFKGELLRVQSEVEKQIVEAPSRSQQINTAALQDVAGILAKAIPVILPLLAAAV